MLRKAMFLAICGMIGAGLAACNTTPGPGKGNGDPPPERATRQQHRLIFAAHPSLGISNAMIDAYIAEMNEIIHTQDYGWDVPCPAVEFVRAGNIIARNDFPVSGPFAQTVRQFRSLAPSANVLLVSSVGCGTVAAAAGCANIGAEPAVTALIAPGFEALTVLHERGHNMSLNHSAESPASDRSVPENVGMRYMFWRLGVGHLGGIQGECTEFSQVRFPSVASIPAGAAGSPPAVAAAAPAGGLADAPPAPGHAAREAEAAARAGLTVDAWRMVAPPLLDGALPLEDIARLAPEDLASIRRMLQGTPNAYWLNACYVLAIAGGAEDVALIRTALKRRIPSGASALATGEAGGVSPAAVLAVKAAAADALGILANRIAAKHPQAAKQAVEALFEAAHLKDAAEIIGPGIFATSLSQSAQRALALPQTRESRNYLSRILREATRPDIKLRDLRQFRFAPLDEGEIESLKDTARRLGEMNILDFLKIRR